MERGEVDGIAVYLADIKVVVDVFGVGSRDVVGRAPDFGGLGGWF